MMIRKTVLKINVVKSILNGSFRLKTADIEFMYVT